MSNRVCGQIFETMVSRCFQMPDGRQYTLADMLEHHGDEAESCQWLHEARVGDVCEDGELEGCRRVV
jgi:hypothetical protein